jgi:hypothetical protein
MEKKPMKPVFCALFAASMLTTMMAQAQNASGPSAAAPPETANPADVPGLGEIMTLQQLRHIKLWFAGRAGNWPLADYEIGELQEGFDDVDKQLGGGTVDKMVGAAIKGLQKVVDDKDRAAFPAAFDKAATRAIIRWTTPSYRSSVPHRCPTAINRSRRRSKPAGPDRWSRTV